MQLKEFKIQRYYKWLLPIISLYILVYFSCKICEVNFNDFWGGFSKSCYFLAKMFPPDWGSFQEMLVPTIDSLLMAILGTFFGTILSLFIAIFAASNISNKWIKAICRGLISIERAIPELFILLILITAFGFGAMPGVIALMLGCVGMMGKFFADAIEDTDPVILESMRSLGADKIQTLYFGIIPQIFPTILSTALFRLEINIRLSIILGAVGAGGIGYELENSFSMLQYNRALSALLIVLVMVFGIEKISNYFRNKLHKDG
ncbi:phosphonate ABC transporter, permease protein PhnE [Parasediminibacterium paludis]|uniref:Phosphonate ABC transporter, permease protein PhnE n=1 Tax=Parasediminibacterium paludis TaxID=908966 RepID=A0ABV8PX27_9BACT